jgi:hypothetical protein
MQVAVIFREKLTLQTPAVTYILKDLTFNNSTFFPHSICFCGSQGKQRLFFYKTRKLISCKIFIGIAEVEIIERVL